MARSARGMGKVGWGVLERMGHGHRGRSRRFISSGPLLSVVFRPVQDELRCVGIQRLLNGAVGGLCCIRAISRLAQISKVLLHVGAHDERVVVEGSVLP